MPRSAIHPFAAALALLAAACAPSTAPPPAAAPPAPAAAPAERPLLRDVPVPPEFRAAVAQGTRSEDGAPGPRYWQQSVRYQIDAELDPETATLRGTERIVYHNQSPERLTSIVLNLYQNVFSEGVPRNRYVPVTGGVTLERVAVQGRTLPLHDAGEIPVVRTPEPTAPEGYAVQGTLARLVLPRPLAPGDSAVLEVDWHHRVPPAPSFRTGWEDALGGRALHVAQWYPQVATFDDLDGWDATPYLGDGEFYTEYGDFDVSITVPTGFLVGSTGVLQNPDEVLTAEAQRRLALAEGSDTITRVVTEADVEASNATQPSPDGQLTWRFHAEDVRDFAFATSDRYVWDATRAEMPTEEGGTRSVPVHALYRPGAPHWQRAALFGQHATEHFSRQIVPYPYPQVTVAEGPVGGMEYPMLVFIGKPRSEEGLYGVIAHEVGHEWFPMLVGSNEAAHAWMDEGFTTYHENLASADFFDLPEAAAFQGDVDRYLGVAGTADEVPLMRHTDLVTPYGARTVAAYTKPGVLMRSLRAVLGDSVLDRAMRVYADEWRLKHPAPSDFFHTVERVAGRELDWFFYPWWFETGTLDQEIAGVEGAGTGVATVTVSDLGGVPAPTLLVGRTAAGQVVTATVPIETWLGGTGGGGTRTATAVLRADAPITEIALDPEQIFPDVNPDNNLWTAPTR